MFVYHAMHFMAPLSSPSTHFSHCFPFQCLFLLFSCLSAWFADADDGKLVLRLATTLLSDSFRSTLCLQYSEHQLSLAMVFMSLCILNLQPTNSNSMSYSYHRNNVVSGGNNGNSGNDTTWLDLIEKDIDEQVLQSKYTFVYHLYVVSLLICANFLFFFLSLCVN